jgi:hypothetical protein
VEWVWERVDPLNIPSGVGVPAAVEAPASPPGVLDRVFELGRDWRPTLATLGREEKVLAGVSAAFLAGAALAEARRDRRRPSLV